MLLWLRQPGPHRLSQQVQERVVALRSSAKKHVDLSVVVLTLQCIRSYSFLVRFPHEVSIENVRAEVDVVALVAFVHCRSVDEMAFHIAYRASIEAVPRMIGGFTVAHVAVYMYHGLATERRKIINVRYSVQSSLVRGDVLVGSTVEHWSVDAVESFRRMDTCM